MKNGKRPDTVLTHAGRHPHDFFGVVNTPVFHASTILSRTVAERLAPKGPRDPAYGRRGTPTMFTLEDAVAEIEGAAGAVICPSGMAAVALGYSSMLSAGDHVLVADCVYAPARRYATEALPRHGIGATFFDPAIGAGIAELMRPETKLVYLEAPGSQTFEMQDVPAIAEVAHARGARVAIDNTWATPLFFKPFDHGADLSIHAATKYIVGHSDAMLGVVTCRDAESLEAVRAWWNMTGLCAGPDDIYLGTRGIRTMSVRLARHQENAMRVATWLQGRAEVERVLYPALPDDPGHEIWKRDFTGASGLFGLLLNPASAEAVAAMLDGLELFGMGSSWGGFESLIVPSDPTAWRTATVWNPAGPLLRLHIGLEDPDDLIADLDAGFARLRAAG